MPKNHNRSWPKCEMFEMMEFPIFKIWKWHEVYKPKHDFHGFNGIHLNKKFVSVESTNYILKATLNLYTY